MAEFIEGPASDEDEALTAQLRDKEVWVYIGGELVLTMSVAEMWQLTRRFQEIAHEAWNPPAR